VHSIRHRAATFAAVLVGAPVLALGAAPGVADAVTTPNIAAAPTQVARTALGTVGYREIGRGSTLLMITGFSAGMDDWAPFLIDDLAEHFKVVVFDNAGIGRSAPLPAPLTVPAMAEQTSDLIRALRLGRCDVLGWSMGGLIAQSLAVTDPGQVRRLVLAATQAGTGQAAPVPSTAQVVLDSGNVAAVLGLLFPADQAEAAQRYVDGILTYPVHYTASAAVRTAQQAAIDQWFAGDDASGRRPGEIKAPTLVADGTQDALNPSSNDHMLADLIPGARLVLYPDAGHGFLFQDAPRFEAELESFLR
jgi:pimeloyl-ACP methyl ester carboxylesterase